MNNCAFSSPEREMENEVSHLERVSQRAQEQQRQAWEAQVEQARRQSRPNLPPAGDYTYYDDLAQLRRAEIKRGTYTKRPRPASLPDLRGCDGDVLLVLSYLAHQGKSAVSKSEIGRRIGKHPETVRLSLRRLEAAGMLCTAQRQGVAIRKENGRVIRIDPPNSFTITDKGWMTLSQQPPAAARSAAVSTKFFRHPSESKNITTCTNERSAETAHTTAARSAPIGAARPTMPKPETPEPSREAKLPSGKAGGSSGGTNPHRLSCGAAQKPINRREPASAEALARAAAQKLTGPEIEFAAAGDPFEILDRVRRQHLSRFDGGAWSRAVMAHGRETALLAAAVAMLRREDGRGRPITSRASYLGAMLRQSPAALNPAPSLHLLV